jgi:hypothetical protein
MGWDARRNHQEGKTTEYIAKKKKKKDWIHSFRSFCFLIHVFRLKKKQTGSLMSQAEKAKWKGRENNNNDNNAT